jgi:antitoxin (DNA-binding transcriptional repressor) of toxin-antitoxin stability system
MGFSSADVVPFTQARANLSELAEQAKAGFEKIITKGDYLILYIAEQTTATAYLLTIRHHRELSFDFAKLWPVKPISGS